MYLLVIDSSVKIIETVHQKPKLFMKSMESCDNNACVQCQRTKYVDFRFPKKNINVAIRLTIGNGSPTIIAIKDIR